MGFRSNYHCASSMCGIVWFTPPMYTLCPTDLLAMDMEACCASGLKVSKSVTHSCLDTDSTAELRKFW